MVLKSILEHMVISLCGHLIMRMCWCVDYCNFLLFDLHKLQLIQNKAALIITRTPSIEHITPALQQLHWLPIKFRIDFKILLLTFKILHNLVPSYLWTYSHLHTFPNSLPHLPTYQPWGQEPSVYLPPAYGTLSHQTFALLTLSPPLNRSYSDWHTLSHTSYANTFLFIYCTNALCSHIHIYSLSLHCYLIYIVWCTVVVLYVPCKVSLSALNKMHYHYYCSYYKSLW